MIVPQNQSLWEVRIFWRENELGVRLEAADTITEPHIAEAIRYRDPDRPLF